MLDPGARVCIIGGGSVGIYAAKQCLEDGLSPTVFEQRSVSGGVWQQHWNSLRTNSSVAMMTTSDFPFPFPTPVFPTKSDICKYVEAYIVKFNLRPCIQYNTKVVAVRPSGKAWEVECVKDGIHTKSQFDSIFCCNGQFSQPRKTTIPESKLFSGRIRHSSEFRDGVDLRGKHVLILGIGNSALDVALESMRAQAASTTVSCRNGTMVLPVASKSGIPVDRYFNSRLFHSYPSTIKKLSFARAVQSTASQFTKAGLPLQSGVPGPQLRVSNLKEHPAWVDALCSKSIGLATGVEGFCGPRQIKLLDGRIIPVDEVIVCTGYDLSFPFLPESITKECVFSFNPGSNRGSSTAMVLHRRILHPRYPTLCFLGYVVTLGNDAALGELQARWACAFLTKRLTKMPTEETISKSTDAYRSRIESKRPMYPMFEKYVNYCEILAGDLGVRPPALISLKSLKAPRLAYDIFFGPLVMSQYRIQGRGSLLTSPKEVHRLCKL